MTVVEETIQFANECLDALATELLPGLSSHMAQIVESLAHQTLQIDVHRRRKWNFVIHGIGGPAGEEEDVTRAKCIKFPGEALKVDDPDNWHLAACHWLSQKANAGIILRFVDPPWGQGICEAIRRRVQFRLTCRPSFDP